MFGVAGTAPGILSVSARCGNLRTRDFTGRQGGFQIALAQRTASRHRIDNAAASRALRVDADPHATSITAAPPSNAHHAITASDGGSYVFLGRADWFFF